MTFDVAIRLTRGAFSSETSFRSDAAVTALVGPSGSGKTSILLAMAGLVRPDAGHIRIGGRTVFDSAAAIDVPARQRNLGVVFQDGRLFPHLRVRANLGYAAQAAPRAVEAARAVPHAVEAMAERLGLAALLDRWPRHLSGGEARRVALGRALLARPAALLLDEPLSHLDAARAADLLDLVADVARTIPVFLITHDLREATHVGADIIHL